MQMDYSNRAAAPIHPKMYQPEKLLHVFVFPVHLNHGAKALRVCTSQKSSRGEPHPIQELGFTAVQAVATLLLWSIIHIKEKMKESSAGGGHQKKRGSEGKPERKTWGEGELGKPRWLQGEKHRGNKDGETEAGAVSGREIGGAAAATAPCSVFCHSSINSSSNH